MEDQSNINLFEEHRSFGEVISDMLTNFIGSWYFICIQSFIIVLWVIFNGSYPDSATSYWNLPKWDPYPFIFLNLMLSFQAAYTAPIIMMSQNREEARDRKRAEADFLVNTQAEKEITDIESQLQSVYREMRKLELLHKKQKGQKEIL